MKPYKAAEPTKKADRKKSLTATEFTTLNGRTDGRLNRRTHACMYWLNDATRRALLPPKTVIEKCLTVDIQQTDYIFEEYVGKYVMKMECENKNGLTIISNNRQYKIIKRMAGHSNNVKI